MTSRPTILCVDDEAMVVKSLRDQLRRGFAREIDIEIAESGEEGLEVLEDLFSDGISVPVVISDQLMPGMRGEAFLAEVHRRDPRILTVLLTGQATADAVGAAVNEAKLYRYIGKPWGERDLMLTLRSALTAYTQARELEHQEAEMRRTHEASLRFVPREFIGMLGHERVVDVSFGDHTVRHIHILFSDMRGYTTMVEGQTAAATFHFVNEYLQRMEQPIVENGGFVSSVEGDAILALFPGSVDDAVRAGIDSQRVLRQFSAERRDLGQPPVFAGLGVHSGTLLLGAVGREERLRCDVFGDAVNLAARLESLTKTYGAGLLVSGESVAQLDGSAELRRIDRVRVKGKTRAVELYEVLDALADPTRALRLQTRTRFEEGGRLLQDGELDEALRAFREVLAHDPEDRAAALLASRCRQFQAAGLPEGWTGEVRLQYK